MTNTPIHILVEGVTDEETRRFDELLQQRGLTSGTFARMQIRAFLKQHQVHGINDALSFGKYQGETLGNVIRLDPDYIAWCAENLPRFSMSDAAADMLAKFLEPEHKE